MKATELCPAGTVSQVGMLYRSKSRSLGKGLLAGALMTAALAAALPSYCQVWVVHHNFNLQLTAKQVYRVAWKGDVDILARDKGGVDSLTQTQLFGPALAPAADILGPKVVIAPLFGAFSTAYSQFSAAANGTGFHEVGGNLGVFPPVGILAVSSASSAIGLNVGAVDGKGRIKWQPNWHFDRIGKTKIKDPIDFSVLNLDTGALMESRLLEIDAEDEDGSASWENGRVQINGGTGSFTVLLTSPFITSGQGIMRLSYVNGVVVDSEDSGIFDGLLPAVGSAANVDIPVGDSNGDLDIGFDFGAANTNGFQFDVGLGASGIKELAVPEPGAYAFMAGTLIICASVRRRRRI